MQASSLTASSPFASPAGVELLERAGLEEGASSVAGAAAPLPDEELLEFGDAAAAYDEEDANLDPLSAMEKYCRSELPQQRLAYAAGMGAAVELFEPHEVSGTLVSLLRELLGDVYADVRLTALQQVLPVARRLRSVGALYQSDVETLWDLVQKLLLDADVENQEAASAVLAELSHVVAMGNAVVASQKLVLAVQKLQRVPTELHSEGALAALRLVAQVVAPRQKSPLTFATIEEFSVGAFKHSISTTASSDLRQAVVLLLPRFARHMPPALRASLLPGWVKTLAGDTHWNVRAKVPQLLIELLTPHDQQELQQQQMGVEGCSISSSGGCSVLAAGLSVNSQARAGATTAAAGCAADSWSQDDLRLLCDVTDKLCKDTSLQVKVAALAALGQLLPLLPASLVSANKPPLLCHFVSTARPAPALAGTRVPALLCPPRLSGHLAAARHRQRQQHRQVVRSEEERQRAYMQGLQDLINEMDTLIESDLQKERSWDAAAAAAGRSAPETADPAAASAAADQDGRRSPPWVLPTASDTPVGNDDGDAAPADAADAGASSSSSGADAAAIHGASSSGHPRVAEQTPGTAGYELPHMCALYLGRVAVHTSGSAVWQQHLQGAFVQLAGGALNGDYDVAASLLLAFPDLSAALGHQEAATILIPVVLELLHTRLDALTPVLSVTLLNIVSALPPELRICLLQMLPNLVLLIDPEFAGDWRARRAVAQQLSAVAGMVSSPDGGVPHGQAQVAYCLWPLLVSLLRDPVSAVRAAAAEQAGSLLLHLPSAELPPEQDDAAKAAAAAAALRPREDEAPTAAGDAQALVPSDEDAEAAEHAIAAVVATRAVSGSRSHSHSQPEQQQQQAQQEEAVDEQEQEQQQQQQDASRGPGLSWVRRGLTSGLSQLQQQVDRVMESPGLQKALNGMDQQLTWLQEHPHGKVLWHIGSKLAQGVRGAGDADAAGTSCELSAQTLEDLRRQLTSLQVMEAAALDPCKFLATPAWHALARELLALGSNADSCNDRLAFVIAAGSILSACASGCSSVGGEALLQQLLLQLQQLSADPAAGVRCAVAAVAGILLSQGAFARDMQMSSSVCNSPTTTASNCTSPVGGLARGGSNSPGGGVLAQALQQPAETPSGCSGGGVSSLASSGILCAPTTARAVLQGCLQRLQRDPCVSVAEAAGRGTAGDAADDGSAGDAGVAVAAAAAADAAALASSPPVVAPMPAGTAPGGGGEAADLL